MPSDVIYDLDEIKVVWSQRYAVYEVWQLISGGPDDILWDCVADTPDQEEAVLIADDLFFKQEEVPQDYYESAIDF